MNSENPPAIYTLAALRALPEWKESGRVLNLSTVEDPEFQDIVSSVPDTMRLTDGGPESYGIPYGVEGIGYIVNKNMLSDLFGSDNGELVLTELVPVRGIDYPIHRFWYQYVCVYDDRLH